MPHSVPVCVWTTLAFAVSTRSVIYVCETRHFLVAYVILFEVRGSKGPTLRPGAHGLPGGPP
jgi:hypothetical protein